MSIRVRGSVEFTGSDPPNTRQIEDSSVIAPDSDLEKTGAGYHGRDFLPRILVIAVFGGMQLVNNCGVAPTQLYR